MMNFEEIILYGAEIFHEVGEKCRDELYHENKDICLTESQRFYLQCTATLEKPTLSGIAQKLGIAKSSVSIAIDKLIRLGYIEKSKLEKDKRVSVLSLTELGNRAVFLDQEVHRLATQKIKSILSEQEITQLSDIFKKIIDELGNN